MSETTTLAYAILNSACTCNGARSPACVTCIDTLLRRHGNSLIRSTVERCAKIFDDAADKAGGATFGEIILTLDLRDIAKTIRKTTPPM